MFWKTRKPAPTPPAAPPAARAGKLIVHIGDRKTGSTSIQNALAANRVHPDGASLLYPSRLAHNHLLQSFGQKGAGKHAKNFTQIAKRIAEAGADFSILSAEELEDMPPKKVHAVLQTHFRPIVTQVQVLAYVRPHIGRITSSCAEQLKIGLFAGDSIEAFFERALSNGRFFYVRRFTSWRYTFGTEFVLRPMIRSELHNASVVEDFLHEALNGTPFRLDHGTSDNESLNLRDLMILKLVHGCGRKRGLHQKIGLGWSIARHLNQRTTGTDSAAPPERLRTHKALAVRIADTYREDAQAVDQAFFEGRPLLQTALDQMIDSAPETAQSLDPADHFSDSEQRSILALADTISEMMDNTNGAPWPKYFRDGRIKALQNG